MDTATADASAIQREALAPWYAVVMRDDGSKAATGGTTLQRPPAEVTYAD